MVIYKDEMPVTEIVPLKRIPNKKEAEAIIRKLAVEGKIGFHEHARKNMKKRKITTLQILKCLEKGTLLEEPFTSHSHKGYETSLERSVAGDWIKVVVCLRWSQDLLVITAIN